ncbi:MAG: glycosyltransferase [Alphaproteobacteria bacterium]|nr:glycosyltransferase [Alphaproteobacteria bacterium]
MYYPNSTRVYSIFDRLGKGGGGKVRAVLNRLNGFAEMEGYVPVLLNLSHSVRQKINFLELQSSGVISANVVSMTLPEACYDVAAQGDHSSFDFPPYDTMHEVDDGATYTYQGEPVMADEVAITALGSVTKRTVFRPKGDEQFTLINGRLFQKVRKWDQFRRITDYVNDVPIRWADWEGRNYIRGRNLLTGEAYKNHHDFERSFFKLISWDNSVVFFDGVTSAYLSPATAAPRVLFLHADHRSPSGQIVPRSKFLIENFKGEAIVTSTDTHKKQIEEDVTPAAEIHVVPHFCDRSKAPSPLRRNLVTVSRLDLVGKPIDECVKAFHEICDDFPDVDYLIYGEGSGQKRLEALIADFGRGSRIHLMGYTTDPDRVFRGALTAVYPTLTEGFGLSILEALSAGCPVISYDVNYGPREMILRGQNGELVAPGDIASLADAMRKVLSDAELYQRNTDLRLDRYSREAYLSNYQALVEKVLKPTFLGASAGCGG